MGREEERTDAYDEGHGVVGFPAVLFYAPAAVDSQCAGCDGEGEAGVCNNVCNDLEES